MWNYLKKDYSNRAIPAWSEISKNKIYPVRLPILNPRTAHLNNLFNIKLYFYAKSNQPPEFWITKGSSVSLNTI